MTVRRPLVLMLIVSLLTVPGLWPVAPPPPAGAQGTEVWIKATGSGARKLNIAIPEFTVTTVSPGADAGTAGKLLASDDNWISDQLNIIGSQLAPTSERESAADCRCARRARG